RDGGDREQQRGDADQRVAHGADPHDRAHVGPQAVDHVAAERTDPRAEQVGLLVAVLDLAAAHRPPSAPRPPGSAGATGAPRQPKSWPRAPPSATPSPVPTNSIAIWMANA